MSRTYFFSINMLPGNLFVCERVWFYWRAKSRKTWGIISLHNLFHAINRTFWPRSINSPLGTLTTLFPIRMAPFTFRGGMWYVRKLLKLTVKYLKTHKTRLWHIREVFEENICRKSTTWSPWHLLFLTRIARFTFGRCILYLIAGVFSPKRMCKM